MKAVRNKASKRVYFLFEDSVNVVLADDMEADGLRVLDINSQEHEVVDASRPNLYVGSGAMAYDSGEWTVVNQQAYDEARARANLKIQASIVQCSQQRLDDFARTRNYDGILSACTYATSTVPRFQAEGQYCVEARDATWARLYQLLAEIEAGTRPMPAGFADVVSELPVLEWPA